ncbi:MULTISPECIES: hypothetical protein [unclassified Imperialibacter]|uniref:hypothetical protein n=1 Tax=unclassified Imperialibacter TaxID=2629706 RepID=UPI00125F60A0|nr:MULTISPECIES: hypothetical protein [unclassified Imperialibacter]
MAPEPSVWWPRSPKGDPVSDGTCSVASGRTDTCKQALKGRNQNRMAVEPHPDKGKTLFQGPLRETPKGGEWFVHSLCLSGDEVPSSSLMSVVVVDPRFGD